MPFLPYETADAIPHILNPDDREWAISEMLETGAFDETPALRRWAETQEAQHILREFLIAGLAPLPTNISLDDLDAAEMEIRDQDTLAADIEARFG